MVAKRRGRNRSEKAPNRSAVSEQEFGDNSKGLKTFTPFKLSPLSVLRKPTTGSGLAEARFIISYDCSHLPLSMTTIIFFLHFRKRVIV